MKKSKTNIELEAHFLNIAVPALHKKLKELGARDLGEDHLTEIIFYNKSLSWREEHKFVRLRKTKNNTIVSFKHHKNQQSIETKEIEFMVNNFENAKQFLIETGLVAFREQEKKRHTYTIQNVTVDIDTWPSVPPYVEIEGTTRKEIRQVAEKLGYNWQDAVFAGAGYIIEHYYGIPVLSLRYFKFDRIEK